MNRKLTVFLFHSVLREADPLMPDLLGAEAFARQLRIIGRHLNVLPLSDAIERLQRGALPRNAVSITFDDGYANNCEVAWPLLRAHGMPATIFVAPGYLDGGIMFNDIVCECVRHESRPKAYASLLEGHPDLPVELTPDKLSDAILEVLKYLPQPERRERALDLAHSLGVTLPTDVMMTTEQLRQIASEGVEIGAHTMTHPILSQIGAQDARHEIDGSKLALEAILGREVRLFAYPNGVPGKDFSTAHVEIVEDAGFSASFTTSPGVARPDTDRFQLPRFGPWSVSPARFLYHFWRNARVTAAVVKR